MFNSQQRCILLSSYGTTATYLPGGYSCRPTADGWWHLADCSLICIDKRSCLPSHKKFEFDSTFYDRLGPLAYVRTYSRLSAYQPRHARGTYSPVCLVRKTSVDDKSRICQVTTPGFVKWQIPDLSSWICGFVKNYRRYQKGVFRVSCSLYIIICSLKGEKCSCNTWAQAQDRASGPCLQHFKIPASLTSTFTSQTWTQSKHLDIRAHSKHHRRPSLHPQTTWFHANHKMQVGGTACHTTQLAPQPRGKRAPPPTCASLFRHHDRSTMAQSTQDIFPWSL